MKNLLSIVIPCYNDWQFVAQSIESAINQTYQNKEIIVVDDGSDNRTKEVLKKLESKITRLITQENKGQSRARNVGISVARGDYILILDSDDFFAPEFAEKAIKVIENSIDIKIVTCFVNRVAINATHLEVFKPHGGDILDFLNDNAAIGTSMFRRKDWEEIEGYDESMTSGFEDWEFFIRLLKHGGSCHVIQEPLFNYRQRSNSTSSGANKIKYDLLRYIYFKHQDLYKSNLEQFVCHLLSQIEREEKEKLKNLRRIEYKIGFELLRPFRWIKKLSIIKCRNH